MQSNPQLAARARVLGVAAFATAVATIVAIGPWNATGGPHPPMPDGSRLSPRAGVQGFSAAGAFLSPVFTDTGKLSLSIDGLGTFTPSGGIVTVEKAGGATVRRAFLAAASVGFSEYTPVNGDVRIEGVPVSWDPVFTIT